MKPESFQEFKARMYQGGMPEGEVEIILAGQNGLTRVGDHIFMDMPDRAFAVPFLEVDVEKMRGIMKAANTVLKITKSRPENGEYKMYYNGKGLDFK